MATLLSPDEKARMALRVFQHFGSARGEALRPDSFAGFGAKHGWTPEDVAEGLEYGRTLGWFVDGQDGSTRLTAAGTAEILAGPPLGQGARPPDARSRWWT